MKKRCFLWMRGFIAKHSTTPSYLNKRSQLQQLRTWSVHCGRSCRLGGRLLGDVVVTWCTLFYCQLNTWKKALSSPHRLLLLYILVKMLITGKFYPGDVTLADSQVIIWLIQLLYCHLVVERPLEATINPSVFLSAGSCQNTYSTLLMMSLKVAS